MNSNLSEIGDDLYTQGKALNEAIFQFGRPEFIEAYEITLNPPQMDRNSSKGFMGLLGDASLAITKLQDNKYRREKIYQALQKDILELIKKGDLLAFGFKEPRDLNDKAIKIPADLFYSGDIKWDNSELKSRNFEFTGIRLLKDLMPVIDIGFEKDEFQDIKKIDHLKSIKSQKRNFSDLDPELHINEEGAAELLGISKRTLQGYRVKGGGPEFRKIGKKAVRYKIADLMNWSEGNKRKNTSY